MRKKLLNVVVALLLAALAAPLAACARDATQTEADQAPLETKQDKEEIHLKEPVPHCGLEPSGQWYAWQGVVGGDLSITDGATDEKMEFEEVKSLCYFIDIPEYDSYTGDRELPTNLHVMLSDGTDGNITDSDVICDLWDRCLYLRFSPDLAMPDPGTFVNNTLVFSWDDGRTQTFTITGQYALTIDGTLFPLLEGIYSAGEIFNGPSVSPIKNSKYPETIFDTARMMIDDSLGRRTVFFIKYGSPRMDYSEDTFTWNADNDGWGSETYLVKRVEGTDSTPGGILIQEKNSTEPWSCIIEGATRIYVIEMTRDDDGYIYPQITYQPEDSEDRAMCTVKLVGNKLVVNYL